MRRDLTNEPDIKRAFMAWFHQAKPGEVCVYHRGQFSHDRHIRPELNLLSTLALKASDDDRLQLTQKKLKLDRYEYIATRR